VPPKQIDFAAIAAAALQRARALVEQWCPGGHYAGHEYKALNPTRADSKIGSFSINVATGEWGDFATTDAGKDLISLYAYLQGIDQGEAARELGEDLGIDVPKAKEHRAKRERPPMPPPDDKPAVAKRSKWTPILPVPADAPDPPKASEYRGLPEASWRYLDMDGQLLGVVGRFLKSDGGKDIIPFTYCQHEKGARNWREIAFPEPRPLYGLEQLKAKADAPLVFVEGEKCKDVADEVFLDHVALTWPGGGNAVGKADFSLLAERPNKKAILWPDCDSQREKLSKEDRDSGVMQESKPYLPKAKQPGMAAMLKVAAILHGYGYEVKIVNIPGPGEVADGWDIADARKDGLDDAAIRAWAMERLGDYGEPEQPAESASTPKKAAAREGKEYIPDLIWGKERLSACLSNVYQILTHVKAWHGVIAFDEFSQRIVKLKPPPYDGGVVGEWDSTDDTRTAIWLSQFDPGWGFTPSSATIAEAVEVLGREKAFHPVREYLSSLPAWDGTRRLTEWLTDYLGVPKTEYSQRVGAFFLRAMVARVMHPGVKFDYCLVLSGTQGLGKSTALRILGGEWYADTDLDLNNKDSMSALRGKWLYEFGELGSLARAESMKQKSFLSRMIDEFRPVYGRREIKCPRQVAFAGSTNEWEWNKDPTGGRRFWPVDVHEVDREGLTAARDQLFAEALHDYLKGKRFHPTPDEQAKYFDPEQLKVEMQNSFIDALHDWVEARTTDFSLYTAATEGLKLDAGKLNPSTETKIGQALRKLGCTKFEKRNGMTRFWYRPPNRRLAESKAAVSGVEGLEVPDVGF
jgi:predicted P-loop ATPase